VDHLRDNCLVYHGVLTSIRSEAPFPTAQGHSLGRAQEVLIPLSCLASSKECEYGSRSSS